MKKENLLVQMYVWRDSSDLHLLTRVNCQKRDGYIPNDLLRELRKDISWILSKHPVYSAAKTR